MILAGEFRDTERVTEADLAKRLSVSRTPVREALLRLEGEGLVFAQGRGVRMRYLSRSELIEVFEARAVLEGLAAERAAQRSRSDQFGDPCACWKAASDPFSGTGRPAVICFSALHRRRLHRGGSPDRW